MKAVTTVICTCAGSWCVVNWVNNHDQWQWAVSGCALIALAAMTWLEVVK